MTIVEARELFAYNGWANRRSLQDGRSTEYTHRLGDMVRHVVNHSTYHRGQLATQMRQLGEAPPGTDLILYLLEDE